MSAERTRQTVRPTNGGNEGLRIAPNSRIPDGAPPANSVQGLVESTMHSCSVLIASYKRPQQLSRCLEGLARQTRRADELVVIWQSEDEATRDLALSFGPAFHESLRTVHCQQAGIVPALNSGLRHAIGEIVVLIDDDAIAPGDWLEKHLRHYADPTIGAVGGPALNHFGDGQRFPVRQVRQIGKLLWHGKMVGYLNDGLPAQSCRTLLAVDVLAGNNMSLRRRAFSRFDDNLKDYWQYFEVEACQQVKLRGFGVVFDFSNPVFHYPASTNKVYDGSRDGDINQKFYAAAYNHAYTLSKYTNGLLRVIRFLYLITTSSVPYPGPIKYLIAVFRYGNPSREFHIMLSVLRGHYMGWRDGKSAQVKKT